ncbi:MAG TPA: hypothetical protein DD638_06105 [Pasteurellaceae bacterium]|nr:hypothetical protein [Pasteurellaceae bacterium]
MAACTNEVKKINSDSEYLYTFLVNDNEFYVVGEKYDYVFDGESLRTLQRFLVSKYAKSILYSTVTLQIYEGKNVTGYYDIYLDPKKVSENDHAFIQKEFSFQFDDAPSVLDLKQKVLKRVFISKGILAKLENHDELLAKYKSQEPLRASVEYYENTTKLDRKVIGNALVLPLTVPVSVVAGAAAILIFGSVLSVKYVVEK